MNTCFFIRNMGLERELVFLIFKQYFWYLIKNYKDFNLDNQK